MLTMNASPPPQHPHSLPSQRNISNYTVTGVDELSEFFALMEETVVPIITCHILATYDEEIKRNNGTRANNKKMT